MKDTVSRIRALAKSKPNTEWKPVVDLADAFHGFMQASLG